MVSFSCNGCSDVITKPKLDQHWSRCRSSFDCIDCSKSFKSPSEWKAHTSCITEAEKYQKSLYKGPSKTKGKKKATDGSEIAQDKQQVSESGKGDSPIDNGTQPTKEDVAKKPTKVKKRKLTDDKDAEKEQGPAAKKAKVQRVDKAVQTIGDEPEGAKGKKKTAQNESVEEAKKMDVVPATSVEGKETRLADDEKTVAKKEKKKVKTAEKEEKKEKSKAPKKMVVETTKAAENTAEVVKKKRKHGEEMKMVEDESAEGNAVTMAEKEGKKTIKVPENIAKVAEVEEKAASKAKKEGKKKVVEKELEVVKKRSKKRKRGEDKERAQSRERDT